MNGSWYYTNLNAMKPPTALLPILLLSFSMSASAGSVAGAENDSKVIGVENVGREALGYDELAHGATSRDERLVRIVARATNGRYLVAVRSNIGITRMKGAYLDSALTVEDGDFTFYYANGRIESSGKYVHGSKSGTWTRYALDGASLAERNYTGLNTEELLTALGVGKNETRAQATSSNVVARSATRRSIAPVEF